MSDFENVKKNLIETNEKHYGKEIKEEYGEEVYEATNDILKGITEEQWVESERLRVQVESMLKELTPQGDPSCEKAMEMAKLHGMWARTFWAEGMYSADAHLALVNMYVEDQRFTAYYDAIVSGGAKYLRDAVGAMLAQNDSGEYLK